MYVCMYICIYIYIKRWALTEGELGGRWSFARGCGCDASEEPEK